MDHLNLTRDQVANLADRNAARAIAVVGSLEEQVRFLKNEVIRHRHEIASLNGALTDLMALVEMLL